MKKRIQKYLSGSNEGFSLVELIIVIAIMAILVGVVALAVIPNLEKSRESKDLATLDSVCSALGVSVASAGNKAGSGVVTFDVTTITGPDASDPVKDEMFKQLGDCSGMKLGSSVGSGKAITCEYDTSNNVLEVYADGKPSCKYAKDDQGNLAVLRVTNVGKGAGAAAGGAES